MSGSNRHVLRLHCVCLVTRDESATDVPCQTASSSAHREALMTDESQGCRWYGDSHGDSHGYGYGMGMGIVMNPHGFCG